jgi:plasmid rolling circle replication initiator protein Rep
LNNEIKKYLGNMIKIDSIYNNNKWKNEEVTIFFKSLKSIMGIFNRNFLDYFKKFQNLDINAQFKDFCFKLNDLLIKKCNLNREQNDKLLDALIKNSLISQNGNIFVIWFSKEF